MRSRGVMLTALATLFLGCSLLTGSGATARTPFDGAWSVSVITDAGQCDRGYRYAVRILNGRIYYDNPNIDVSGQVNARGQITVTVRAGQSAAVGAGRMSAEYGEGRWSGRSTAGECSGHWEAERRE